MYWNRNSDISFVYGAIQTQEGARQHDEYAKSIAVEFLEENYAHHTKFAITCNNLAIALAVLGETNMALNLCHQVRQVFATIVRKTNYLYAISSANMSVINHLNHGKLNVSLSLLKEASECVKTVDPRQNLGIFIDKFSNIRKLLFQDSSTLSDNDILGSCFTHLFGMPLGWIDYCPIHKCIILGADSPVWEHLEKLNHM